MANERWRQIEEIYYAALERTAGERAAFLAERCASDEDLRCEIEALLESNSQAGNFLEAPPDEVASEMFADESFNSLIGRTLSHYQLRSLLGVGGMGEVYLAYDTHLERKAALKLLPRQFTQDRERVQRFRQEARAVSALNHPNIITIFEIGQSDDPLFIVTEFIDGRTLRRRMTAAPLKPGEAIEIAVQIASALAAAHETGIVHRDIKPENVMLRRDGVVKVLDFGLAKLIAPPPGDRAEASETVADAKTQFQTTPGVVLGTPRYMSPEQIRGQEVDGRSDIFSLGIVLFEMAAGRLPFEGSSSVETLAAILNQDAPPLDRYNPGLPAELIRIVGKALRKTCEERYQKASDLLADLKNLKLELELLAKLERNGQTTFTGESQRFTVFLADTSEDLRRTLRRRLITGLREKGIGLADPVPPPLESAPHDQKAIAEIKRADLSLHLFDASPGRDIEDAPDQFFTHRQVELAREHAARQLIWLPNSAPYEGIAYEPHRQFLQNLENAKRDSSSYRFIREPLTADAVVREVLAMRQQFEEEQAVKSAPSAAVLDAHFHDLSHAMASLKPTLDKRQVALEINYGEDEPRKNIESLVEKLKKASRLIVVFGLSSRDWVEHRLCEALKICLEKDGKLKPCGIYFAPPHSLRSEPKFDFGIIPVCQFDSDGLDEELSKWLSETMS